MAREEEDRENLLAEATALVERVKFAMPGLDEPVVAGFRADGGLSIFLGADPVYQFNSRQELRRAFVAGLLYKADRGRLAALRRVRTAGRLELVRHDLDPTATAEFIGCCGTHLSAVREALSAEQIEPLGQVPPEQDIRGRLLEWLEQFGDDIVIARSARAR